MNKKILITGSTDGIGKLTAQKLADNNHNVIIHGRNSKKVDDVVSEIKSISNNNKIEGIVADLSDFDSIRNMVRYLRNNFKEIDVLINNAGVYKSIIPKTKNGINIQFAVNYIAPYLLTKGIIELIKKGRNSRIINLSSAAQSPVSLELLEGKKNLNDGEAYAQSKLAITMWSMYLAKTLKNVSVIPVNPGSLLNTNMVKEAFGKFWSSADKGANILYELSISEKYNGITGKYFDNDQGNFSYAHPDAYNEKKIDKLIETTENLTSSFMF